MNTQETIIQLKDLKLRGMASSLEAIMNTPVQNRPSLNVAVAKLVDAELQDRRERKTEMYLKISRLRYTALIEDVVCGTVHIPEHTRSEIWRRSQRLREA